MKFRKKPVVIDAIQVPNDKFGERDYFAWGELAATLDMWMPNTLWKISDGSVEIPTLEGIMFASPGDWIIRGVHGECYPCKPDIFEKTYERVYDLD